MRVNKDEMYANVRENTRCEGVLFTHPVGYSGSLSTVNETNCNKKEIRAKKKCELTPNSIRMRITTRNLEMKASIAILYVGQLWLWTSNPQRKLLVLVVFVFVDLGGWALQLVLLIRGVCRRFFIMTAAL